MAARGPPPPPDALPSSNDVDAIMQSMMTLPLSSHSRTSSDAMVVDDIGVAEPFAFDVKGKARA